MPVTDRSKGDPAATGGDCRVLVRQMRHGCAACGKRVAGGQRPNACWAFFQLTTFPPGAEVLGPTVLIFEVVGVLPHVVTQDHLLSVGDR